MTFGYFLMFVYAENIIWKSARSPWMCAFRMLVYVKNIA